MEFSVYGAGSKGKSRNVNHKNDKSQNREKKEECELWGHKISNFLYLTLSLSPPTTAVSTRNDYNSICSTEHTKSAGRE